MLTVHFSFAAVFLALSASYAEAGSVGGKAASNQSTLDCDNRKNFILCSGSMPSHVLDKCYVVIHSTKREDCSWQSCGFVSVVGKSPEVNVGKRSVVEYGNSTKLEEKYLESGLLPSSWTYEKWDGGVKNSATLPKFPFPRHYMSVRQALELRNAPDGTDASSRLQQVPQEVIDSNPYLECASRTLAIGQSGQRKYVTVYTGDLKALSLTNATSLQVPVSKVMEACEKLKLVVPGGKCVVGDSRSNFTGAVAIENFKVP